MPFEHPVVEPLPALAERLRDRYVRSCGEAVERHGQLKVHDTHAATLCRSIDQVQRISLNHSASSDLRA